MTATKTIETGRLYGVITPILPDGSFIKCEPVFVDIWPCKHPSNYYLGIKQAYDKKTGISHFEEIDINSYGKTIFLPASHKKVNDGKKYFVMFQSTKNHTKPELQNYCKTPSISLATPDSIYILNIGILFPNKFVAIIADRELSDEEMLAIIR
mgnify:FL=1